MKGNEMAIPRNPRVRIEFWLYDQITRAAGVTDHEMGESVSRDRSTICRARARGRADPHSLMPECLTRPAYELARALAGDSRFNSFVAFVQAVGGREGGAIPGVSGKEGL